MIIVFVPQLNVGDKDFLCSLFGCFIINQGFAFSFLVPQLNVGDLEWKPLENEHELWKSLSYQPLIPSDKVLGSDMFIPVISRKWQAPKVRLSPFG